MASPGHRANILDAHYRETGVGVSPHPPASLADGQAGGIYTQDFGTIIPATGRASRDAGGPSRNTGAAAGTGRSHAGDRTGSSNTGGSRPGTGSDLRAHRKDRRHHHRRHRRHHHKRHRHKRRLRRHRKRYRHTPAS